MTIQLPYGATSIECFLDDAYPVEILYPPSTPSINSIEESLLSAVESPIDSPPLSTFLKSDNRIVVVVPDKTRQCLLNLVLPSLLKLIHRQNIPKENITIIFANGTHPNQTDEEMRKILGADIFESYRILQHDSRNDKTQRYFTTTSRGTKVTVNKKILDADKVITVGGIVHHYFAGFGGGPKLIVPGVASYETARQNHSYTIALNGEFHPDCRDGNLDTNPVYNDISEAVNKLDNIFSINLIIDHKDQIIGITAGNCISSHRAATQLVSKHFEVSVKTLADVVIVSAGGDPRDVTFIQSHKAIHHGYYALKPGGTIIAVVSCTEGIGSETFLHWLSIPKDEIGKKLISEYSLNGHTALSLRNKLKKVSIILISELEPSTVKRMGMIPENNLQKAVDQVTAAKGKDTSFTVIPYGSVTLPTSVVSSP